MLHGEGHGIGCTVWGKGQPPEEREIKVGDGADGKKGDEGQAAWSPSALSPPGGLQWAPGNPWDPGQPFFVH